MFIYNVPGHPRILKEIYTEINVISILANYIILSVALESRSNFRSYYLRNTFPKAVASTDSDSPDRFG